VGLADGRAGVRAGVGAAGVGAAGVAAFAGISGERAGVVVGVGVVLIAVGTAPPASPRIVPARARSSPRLL